MRKGELAALAGVCAVLAACATDQRVAVREIGEVSRTASAPMTNVAVVAIDRDAAARKAWEGAFASRLAARGVATSTGDGLSAGATVDADAVTVDGSPVIEAARKAGADAIVFVRPPNVVPVEPGRSAYRWLGARSGPDPRNELDDAPASVTQVRVFDLTSKARSWSGMIVVRFPRGNEDAGTAAEAAVNALAQRGFVPAR